jgi:uncharacterized protein (DUF2225 family)
MEAQAQIIKNIDKNFYREAKKMAAHFYLGLLLKKKLRSRRQHYLAIKRSKMQYIFEERSLIEIMGLSKMITIEEFPSRAILDLVT